MVEKSHTAAGEQAGWWPSLYEPLRGVGERIAHFFAPSADAAATEACYEINIELPGVGMDDIDVSVHDNLLTLKGEKRSEHEEHGRTYFFSERQYGAFQRSFRLPADVAATDITADFHDGVLTVRVPKTAPAEVKPHRIQVRAG
ncbi:MAG: Hsp20/alpha crystallin family protein [Alphaproteobacteria bacterium]|jgi:HSP20 family protein|nr:Hsp20/alpha crystallin family protein [Alphaproteobacteria bacterium]MDP6517473.1 Hsp20/alpha crystallin family protein [Alphaproteobacteria bacterium]